MPDGSVLGLVITSGRAALTVSVNVRVARLPPWSRACTVKVAVCTRVGRPEISPEEGAKSVSRSPSGSRPAEMENRAEPLLPLTVTKPP